MMSETKMREATHNMIDVWLLDMIECEYTVVADISKLFPDLHCQKLIYWQDNVYAVGASAYDNVFTEKNMSLFFVVTCWLM